jgi:hypothetical protein
MYRPHTILARINSIELTLRRSSSEIAAANRDSSRGTALDSVLVGFTRIALGTHFLTDVLAAIFSELFA